jgi:hypothetical protein
MLALLVKAKSVVDDANATAGQKSWANLILDQINPRCFSNSLYVRFLMDNKDAAAGAITTVLESDAQVQTRVDTAVDALIAEM